MSKLWTDLNNPSLTDDYVSPTSDVLLGELQELPPDSYTAWRTNDFTVWTTVPAAENVAALEDSDLLEPAPSIPDDRSSEHSQTFCVVLSLPEKPYRFFIRFAGRPVTSPYTLLQDRVELSPRQTRFSPDFFNIKKFVTYIMSRTSASPIDQKQLSKTKLTIPTTVSPQVIIESEEKKLTKDLETTVRIAEETYSTLKAIDVNIEHDPEIVDRRTIRFSLTVSGEIDAIIKDEALFKRCLRSNVHVRARELITVTYNYVK